MKIINHEDVQIVKIDNYSIAESREKLLEAYNHEKTNVVMMITGPSESGMKAFGDSVITDKKDEEELNVTLRGTIDIMLGCYYKGYVLPEALRLSLKESLTYLKSNKIKPDSIYLINPGPMTKEEFLNMVLIFQNVLKDLNISTTLVFEDIVYNDISSLSFDKVPKDKKKKKKDKKKGK